MRPIVVPGPVCVSRSFCSFRNIDCHPCIVRLMAQVSTGSRTGVPLYGTQFRSLQGRHSASRRQAAAPAAQPHASRDASQQHSRPSPSTAMSAFFIHAGGRSSATTSASGLNTLKWCRVSASVQNATTVSSGGQPGSAQATSVTRIAASCGSLKRTRVHSFARSRACRYSGRLWKDRSIMEDPAIALRPGSSRFALDQKHSHAASATHVKITLTALGSVLDCARHRSNGDFSVVESVLAAVRVGPSKTEIREYPMPDVPDDAALMKMEVAGICGTDVKLYKTPPTKAPVIMGHENIGTIAKAGREFTRRKGFKEGDLVFVEHYVACGKCERCHLGQDRPCDNTDWHGNPDAIRYGYTSAEKAPHLWGGFARYVYLPWNAVVHHVPKGVTPELAGLVTPMANGVEWSLFDGGVGYNSTVLIQGPGQQGLSQTVICQQAGAPPPHRTRAAQQP